MRDKNGTTQHSIVVHIGELFLVASAKGSLVEFSTAVAKDFDVRIEFSHAPGAVSIRTIKADATVHFDGDNGFAATAERGADLLPLFSHYKVAELEDACRAHWQRGEQMREELRKATAPHAGLFQHWPDEESKQRHLDEVKRAQDNGEVPF